jgi:hypothetical protein
MNTGHLHPKVNFAGVMLETAGQSLNHSQGPQLKANGLRYLRTVTYTAAVYWALGSEATRKQPHRRANFCAGRWLTRTHWGSDKTKLISQFASGERIR